MATDLDGTFLRSDGSVSERTATSWAALAHHGVETVLVTARPPRWMHEFTHVIGSHGIAICGNGAFIYAVDRREIIETHTFESDLLLAIIDDLRAAVPSVLLGVETPSGPAFHDGWPHPHHDTAAHAAPHGGTDVLLAEPVGKLLALAPELTITDFLTVVAEVVGNRGHLAYSGSHGLAEINPLGVTKAAALERWARERSVDAAEVWAFGDMPNDLPMIRWSGRGHAVANAHDDVLAAADVVVPSNDEDGVALTVEALLGT